MREDVHLLAQTTVGVGAQTDGGADGGADLDEVVQIARAQKLHLEIFEKRPISFKVEQAAF